MESKFHSTVLAQPSGMYEDDEQDHNRRRRDILNPSAPGSTNQASPAGPRPPFSLRSPTQSEFHHPQHQQHHYSNSPPGAHSILNGSSSQHSPPPHSHHHQQRSSVLHSPFAQPPGGPAFPMGVQHPPHSSGISSSLQPPQAVNRSPGLHAPPGYYSQDVREHPPPPPPAPREKPAKGSFYDPTTDTTTSTARERRTSDAANSWHNAPPQVSTPKVRTSEMRELAKTQNSRLFAFTFFPHLPAPFDNLPLPCLLPRRPTLSPIVVFRYCHAAMRMSHTGFSFFSYCTPAQAQRVPVAENLQKFTPPKTQSITSPVPATSSIESRPRPGPKLTTSSSSSIATHTHIPRSRPSKRARITARTAAIRHPRRRRHIPREAPCHARILIRPPLLLGPSAHPAGRPRWHRQAS